MTRASASRRWLGFTLLEVMVAVSILGLALTVILSSQAGLLSSATRATHLTVAVSQARCRMNETELYLLKNGYPIIDQLEEGPCCADEADFTYRCEWKIETIQLPDPGLGGALQDGGAPDGGVGLGALGAFGAGTSAPLGDPSGALGAGTAGPLGALAALQQPGGAFGENAGLGDLAGMLGGEGGPGMGGLASMAMGLAYPSLKPMLEASIRKVTVTVKWKEGANDRDLSVVQYVTDPMQGELDEAIKEQGVRDMTESASGAADTLRGLEGTNRSTSDLSKRSTSP